MAKAGKQIEQLRQQARQSDYLFKASAELARTLDLDESLRTAAEAIYGLGQLSYVLIFTGHGELGPYICRAARGLPVDVAARVIGQQYPVPLWGVMARALVSRQPQVIDNAAAQGRPRPGEFDWDVGSGSLLLLPVAGVAGPFALIMAGAPGVGVFSQGTFRDVVFALARLAANTIRNAQLHRQAVRAQEQLVSLQVISRLVASAHPLDEILSVILREASEIMGDSYTWLYLAGAGGKARLSGVDPAADPAWTEVHEQAVAWVMQASEPIFFEPGRALARSPILLDRGAAMCAPLEVNDEAVGALVVARRGTEEPYVEDDMVVLRTLANAAAAALRTAPGPAPR